MGLNQRVKLPIRLQSLPIQAVFPALKKGTRVTSGATFPELSFANGDFINTDGSGCWQARQIYLLLHVLAIEIFHRAVVQAFHLGDGLVRHIPTQLACCMAKRCA